VFSSLRTSSACSTNRSAPGKRQRSRARSNRSSQSAGRKRIDRAAMSHDRLLRARLLAETMAKMKSAATIQVDAHKHVADTRPNIPTRETSHFADEAPQSFVANRDRSLAPQLVWKGKDEQDARPLEVPAVALHVQEKVHPQAIVEDLRARAKPAPPIADLFSDFNGLDDFSKKLEFYQHDQHWTNRLILGDSLLVLITMN